MRRSRALSTFTRVHSPSKTGVNARADALWRGVSKHEGTPAVLILRNALTRIRACFTLGTRAPQDEDEHRLFPRLTMSNSDKIRTFIIDAKRSQE
jgi:hypothetical protein